MEEKKTVPINKKKIIYNALIVAFSIVIIFCLYKIVSYYFQGSQSKNIKEELVENYVHYNENVTVNNGEAEEEGGNPVFSGYKQYPIPASIDFNKLLSQNEDVRGWIYSQNGVINYPILQGDDNSYYLDHLINGKKNVNGSIFMHYTNKSNFTDRNTLIYGHSMDNGTMFATLLRYKKQAYYDAYPTFYLYTPKGNYKIEIFSAYETVADDDAYSVKFTDDEFSKFISSAISKSKVKTNATVGTNDKIVTLSTCAYSSKDARFVVMGKLVSLNDDSQEEKQEKPYGNSSKPDLFSY